MFQRCGVTVHYSFEADCDDTIVAYAVDTNAAILSADKDMFRYNRDLPVYSTFSYNVHTGMPIKWSHFIEWLLGVNSS